MSDDSTHGRAMGTDPESFSGGTHCRWSSRTFIDATFVMAKGGGAEIGATKRGKGMKIMACANKLKRPLDLDTSLFQNGDGDGDVKDTTAIARFLILLRLFFRPAKSERFCNPIFPATRGQPSPRSCTPHSLCNSAATSLRVRHAGSR